MGPLVLIWGICEVQLQNERTSGLLTPVLLSRPVCHNQVPSLSHQQTWVGRKHSKESSAGWEQSQVSLQLGSSKAEAYAHSALSEGWSFYTSGVAFTSFKVLSWFNSQVLKFRISDQARHVEMFSVIVRSWAFFNEFSSIKESPLHLLRPWN